MLVIFSIAVPLSGKNTRQKQLKSKGAVGAHDFQVGQQDREASGDIASIDKKQS